MLTNKRACCDAPSIFSTDYLTEFRKVLERRMFPTQAMVASQLAIDFPGEARVDVHKSPDDTAPTQNRSIVERKESR
jgi:hypothetical protein